MQAFGGTFDVGLHPPPKLKIGNPSPLGLCAFSITTLIMSLYGLNVKISIIVMLLLVWRFLCWHNANISWCLGIFVGNTFATTTMISYGTFFKLWSSLYSFIWDNESLCNR